jgi:streptogramin lyase
LKKIIIPVLFFVTIFSSIHYVNAQQINASDFVYYSQKSSFITEYDVPVSDFGLKGITTDDLGNVWLYHSNNTSSKIIKFAKQSQQFTQYDIEKSTETTDMIINLAGGQIIYEYDNVWFTDTRTNSIGRLDPNTREINLYSIPTKNSGPFGLAFEPNHKRLWFTEFASNKLAVLDVNSNSIQEFDLKEGSGPIFIAFDKSGDMWITLSYLHSILRINLEELSIKGLNFEEYSLPKPDTFSPFGITILDDLGVQKIVLSDHGSNRIILSDLASNLESYSSYWTSPPSVYPQTLPGQVVSDKKGNIFFAQHGGNRISKITNNTMTEFEIPTGPLSTTVYLTVSNDKVWFSEVLANKIGSLDLNNEIPIKIDLSQSYLSLGDKQDSLDVFISGNQSNLLGDISLSLVGMTDSGIQGIEYSFIPNKINFTESIAKSTLNVSAKNLPSGFYDAMIQVSMHDSINKNMTVSFLKPISISINDMREQSVMTQTKDSSIEFILLGLVGVIGIFLLYRRIKLKNKLLN